MVNSPHSVARTISPLVDSAGRGWLQGRNHPLQPTHALNTNAKLHAKWDAELRARRQKLQKHALVQEEKERDETLRQKALVLAAEHAFLLSQREAREQRRLRKQKRREIKILKQEERERLRRQDEDVLLKVERQLEREHEVEVNRKHISQIRQQEVQRIWTAREQRYRQRAEEYRQSITGPLPRPGSSTVNSSKTLAFFQTVP